MGKPERVQIEVSVTDSSLMRQLRHGNQDAATQLYLRYAARLRALARGECSPDLALRVEVDDIIQSVFASFFRGVGQGYYVVPQGGELWKLFLVIALNKIRALGDFHRAAKRDVRKTTTNSFLKRSCAVTEGDHTAFTFLKMVIDEVVEDLSVSQQQMVRLRIAGHDVADIAIHTQRSKRTIERVLQDFRARLARILKEDEGPVYGPHASRVTLASGSSTRGSC